MSDLAASAGPRLNPAVWPRTQAASTRLLHIDPASAALTDRRVQDLPELLRPGDLVVVNDVATLPASLHARTRLGPVEVRLAGPPEPGEGPGRCTAVLFGPGSWRQKTEDRPPPPRLGAGESLAFGGNEADSRVGSRAALSAEIVRVSALSPRLVELRFDRAGASLWAALYRLGHPVQYSHLVGPLDLWHVNTPFGARPWAVEMPSAGRPLSVAVLRALRGRGVGVASLSHAAGLSSTGDPALDRHLPLPERSWIPAQTVEAIEQARTSARRVLAVGTTVVRALEGRASEPGSLRAGDGVTDLHVGPGHPLRVVDGIVSGLHERGESHFELLRAFAPTPLLELAAVHAQAGGYLGHEFGDLCLILPGTA
jgi:S-adenosylmethionine:tRNA ribosyltransferase-isomerase